MKRLLLLTSICTILALQGCGGDDIPPVVNPEEEITKIILRFTNKLNGNDFVTAEWFDEDGDGGDDPIIEPIVLDASKQYTLTVEFINTFETPPAQVTEEIVEEAEEHQIFYAFTPDIFADPTGSGNIDSPAGTVNYDDNDVNDLPLGITTSWETSEAATGTFGLVLKHQPDGLKSESSGVTDGETDADVTFTLIIQ